MAGILDFLQTPAGQGLASAAFSGLAFGKRGAPINTLGRAGLGGILGYTNALNQERENAALDMKTAQLKRQQDAIAQLSPEEQQAVHAGVPYVDIYKLKNRPADFKAFGRDIYNVNQVDPATGQPARVGAVNPEIPFGYNQDGSMVPNFEQGKIRLAQAGRTQNQTNVFNNTKDDFKNERDLRNDFSGLPTVKAFNEVQSAHDQIKTAITKQSPAGDLAAATKIMKLLDPGSVVRESELAMAMQASGALDRLTNYANMTISGQKLTPKQRQDFGGLADQLYSAAVERYDATANEYRGIATDYNLNPDRIAKPVDRGAKPGAMPRDLRNAALEELRRRGIK